MTQWVLARRLGWLVWLEWLVLGQRVNDMRNERNIYSQGVFDRWISSSTSCAWPPRGSDRWLHHLKFTRNPLEGAGFGYFIQNDTDHMNSNHTRKGRRLHTQNTIHLFLHIPQNRLLVRLQQQSHSIQYTTAHILSISHELMRCFTRGSWIDRRTECDPICSMAGTREWGLSTTIGGTSKTLECIHYRTKDERRRRALDSRWNCSFSFIWLVPWELLHWLRDRLAFSGQWKLIYP